MFISSFTPTVQACSADAYGQCGGSCDSGFTCTQIDLGVCGCVAAATGGPTPRATINPNPSPTDYIQSCGTGSCVSGFYCCQQLNGDPACCAVGDVLPTYDPNPPDPTATPVPGNSPPTGTLSCPSSITLGQTGSFTLNGYDVNNNLSLAGLYYSSTASQHWYGNDNSDCNTSPYCPVNVSCTGASCTLTRTWTPLAGGQYYVAANYYDSAGGQCSGNPYGLPAGWADCGSNDYCTVNVVTPTPTPVPPTCNISANLPSINYGGSSNISWSSTNATSCSISTGGWTGTSGGPQNTGSLTFSVTYTCTCSGAGGSGTDSATVTVGPPPSVPIGTCGTFNTTNATTPVTWTWGSETGLQVADSTGQWWANLWDTSPYTVTKDDNNLGSIPGIPPGRIVAARTTYDFVNFSNLGTVTCDMPANQTAVISGVLRQKSGTGCYQADASNNFNISALSGSIIGDDCVSASCNALPGNPNATSYSCTVTWDNAGCVAQGRQPNTAQTLTMSAAATGYSNGQFSNSSCTLSGTSLTVNAGVNNPNADIAFTFTGNNWIKLKDSSFNGISITGVTVPAFVTSYDADDNGSKYFILGNAGAILNATVNPSTAYSSPNNWHASYTKSLSMNPTTFLSYVKSRKQYTKITNLSQITADGIYVWDETISFPAITNATTIPNFNFVLISTTQAVTISRTNFDPAKSVAFIANNITFGNSVQTANGVFIAQTIDTGSTGNLGLKIKGNLIALTTLTNDRQWSDTSRPGLFIVFDPVQYTNLLPYLSTASYEWRQIQ